MSNKAPTLRQFQERFPTEDSCLEHLMRVRFGDRHDCGKCGRDAHFYRVNGRRSYACEYCGAQVYPTAGTPFDRTRTSLRDWFFVMFQFSASRNGVAAKEVERQIGVTYKTAWRMCHEIRKYMAQVDSDEPVGGSGEILDVDETLIGGTTEGMGSGYNANKTCVVGMKERGGDVITRVVSSHTKKAMQAVIVEHFLPGATISTDEFGDYKDIAQSGYRHLTVNHKAGEYATACGKGVNGLESFWAQLKRSINGTPVHVSGKHLPKYLGEFEFRHNRRHVPHLILDELMTAFSR